jgi:hypothetical protein
MMTNFIASVLLICPFSGVRLKVCLSPFPMIAVVSGMFTAHMSASQELIFFY